MRKSFVFLVAAALAAPTAFAASHLWTGTVSSAFSDPANWINGSPAGDPNADLSFPAGSRASAVNDLDGLTIRSISFSGSNTAVSGNSFTIANGGQVADSTAGPNTIANDIVLGGAVTLLAHGDIYTAKGLTLSGAISGGGGVRIDGGGHVVFAGSRPNSYTGETLITFGELQLKKAPRTNAIAGDVRLQARSGIQRPYLSIFTDEQIADTAHVTVGASAEVGIGAVETLGPLTLDTRAYLQMATVWTGFFQLTGTLILGGDVDVVGVGDTNEVSITGTVLISGARRVTSASQVGGIRFFSVDASASASLTFIANDSVSPRSAAEVGGSFAGRTIVAGSTARLTAPSSPVTMTAGQLSGKVGSLNATAGEFDSLISSGDVALAPGVTLTLDFTEFDPTIVRLNGLLTLAGARLVFGQSHGGVPRTLGKVYTVISNASTRATVGTFDGAPEGAILNDRWRISYVGGDGNDVTLTEAGHLGSSVSVSAVPASVIAGESVTLRTTISVFAATAVTATGTVTFTNDGVAIGTAPLTNGVATLVATLPRGRNLINATYSGDGNVLPSVTTGNTLVEVNNVKPILTSVEPSTVNSGTATELTLIGSNFEPGALLSIGAGGLMATFVSPNELRATYTPPRLQEDYSVQLVVKQADPRSTSSDAVTLNIKNAPLPPTKLTFGNTSVTAPVTPGALVPWLCVGRQGASLFSIASMLADTKRDGRVTLDLGRTMSSGTCVAIDLSARAFLAGQPDGSLPPASAFPKKMFLRDNAGRFSHVIVPTSDVSFFMVARPGVGAWYMSNGDGGSFDLDRSLNGVIAFDTTNLTPLGSTSPAKVSAIEPGDLFLWVNGSGTAWFGDRVDDHLSEVSGGGAFSAPGQIFLNETSGVAHVTILRRDGTDPATVDYATVDDTAIGGVQYEARSGTLHFAAGDVIQTIDIPLVNDTIYSGTVRFALQLSNPSGASLLAPSKTVIQINEDDPKPLLFLSAPQTMQEGDVGTVQIPATATLQGATSQPVVVNWTLRESSDTIASGYVTFAPGETQKTIPASFAANTFPGSDRTLVLFISTATDSPATVQKGSATIKIINDDDVVVSIDDASVVESAGAATVFVELSQAATRPVTVTYTMQGGSATAGADFTSASGTITLQGSSGQISIPIINDSTAEKPEWFEVTLTGIQGGTLGRSSAIVMIVDDEAQAVTPPHRRAARH